MSLYNDGGTPVTMSAQTNKIKERFQAITCYRCYLDISNMSIETVPYPFACHTGL